MAESPAPPSSPRLQKQQAIDGVICNLLDTFRGKVTVDGEERWPVRCQLPLKISKLGPDEVDLFKDWEKLDEHVREELQLEHIQRRCPSCSA